MSGQYATLHWSSLLSSFLCTPNLIIRGVLCLGGVLNATFTVCRSLLPACLSVCLYPLPACPSVCLSVLRRVEENKMLIGSCLPFVLPPPFDLARHATHSACPNDRRIWSGNEETREGGKGISKQRDIIPFASGICSVNELFSSSLLFLQKVLMNVDESRRASRDIGRFFQ